MDELLSDFLTETYEGLQQLEGLVLSLESDPNNLEIVRDAFRILHTIKGTCGFLGLDRMQTISHHAENIFGKAREGSLTITPLITSTIFVSLDAIRKICEGIEEKGAEPQGDDREILASLEKCVEPHSPSLEDAPPPSIEGVNECTIQETIDIDINEKLKSTLQEPLLSGDLSSELNTPQKEETPKEIVKSATEISPEKPSIQKESTPKDSAHITGTQQTIRINLDTIDHLMNLVGEMVLTRNQLLQQNENSVKNGGDHNIVLSRLSHLTTELQQTIMKTRMQPIENAWTKLPRMVRDIASELGKKIQLRQIGADTELDRQVIELIKDPLVHMIRNSCDHGIEMPEDRHKLGKNETGTITLRSYHQGGNVILEVSDDGKGMSPYKIREKALSKGLITDDEAATMSHEQILQLIFKPGFSTADVVTSVSGRGVGMDVVHANIDKLGGTIELSSREGNGSTFTIKIPLTLSIISVLLVGVCDTIFALPQLSIVEILNLKLNKNYAIENVEGHPLLRWRNQVLPLVRLSEVINTSSSQQNPAQYIIVTQALNYFFGLVVDNVFDSQEIVVKPLSRKLERIGTFSGSTILGNGEVVLILEPNSLCPHAEKSGGLSFDLNSDSRSEEKSKNTIILIFRSNQHVKAVPLALVSRIDEITISEIQNVNGQHVFLHREQLIPLMDHTDGNYPSETPVPILIFTDRGYKVALKIDEIIDIIENPTKIHLESHGTEDLGTTVINGTPTTVIDSQSYFKKAYPHWHERRGSAEEKSAKRLLLVDDSVFFLNLITPLLQVSGFNVKTAASVDQALKICRDARTPFDVIVSDIEMPDRDGFDFIKALKSNEVFSQIPVVALSGNYTEGDIEKSRTAGFFDFVPKTDQQALIRVLNQIA